MCACVSVCFTMYVENRSALFSRHSCNWNGLMCNPSRHFKGREAWTDVVLLVYQMGLYDEKSIIPIQASLPSLVHYKAIHSFFYCKKIISFFFYSLKHSAISLDFSPPLAFSLFYLHLPLLTPLCFSIPPYLPHLSLCSPLTHSPFALEDLQMWH